MGQEVTVLKDFWICSLDLSNCTTAHWCFSRSLAAKITDMFYATTCQPSFVVPLRRRDSEETPVKGAVCGIVRRSRGIEARVVRLMALAPLFASDSSWDDIPNPIDKGDIFYAKPKLRPNPVPHGLKFESQ